MNITLQAIRTRLRADTGSAAMEMAVIAPVLLLLISLLIMGGRVMAANNSVEQAAADAARAASISRTTSAARSSAQTAAANSLAAAGINCSDTSAAIDTSDFSKDPGRSATVEATVTCVVPLADLALPGVPGTKTVTAHAVSPLDTYRERE